MDNIQLKEKILYQTFCNSVHKTTIKVMQENIDLKERKIRELERDRVKLNMERN